MKIKVKKIEALQRAICIILSENRHVFLDEDIELLEKCLDELEKLKKGLIKKGVVTKSFLTRLTKIITLLDVFFGTVDNIQEFFNDL